MVGKPVVDALFRKLRADSGKDVAISFHDIGPIMMFRWLLNDADAQILDNLAKDIWKSLGEQQEASKSAKKMKVADKTPVVDKYFESKPTTKAAASAKSSSSKGK